MATQCSMDEDNEDWETEITTPTEHAGRVPDAAITDSTGGTR